MHIILQKYGISETITKTSTIDLVKLNIITAKTQKLSQNPGDVYSWITDRNGNLKARIVLTDLIKRSLEIQGSTADIWNPILTWTIDDSVKFLGFSPEYKSLYLFSNVGRDRIGLIEMDIKTQKQKLIVDDPTSDMENIVISHVSNKPIAAAAYPDYQKKYLLDSSYADLFEAFNSNEKKSINIISKDNQERLATLTVMTSTNVSWFLYNRDTKEKELLATRFSPEYSKKLSIMKPISYKSRDGLLINGYLTLPTGTSGKSLPMVLYVHGGPWSRDYWGLSPTVQLLSNRGYAVLQINFRGSSGYGRAFMEAGKGEFAGKMHTDLIDGVDWVVGQGIADPDKIAILGQSYGGYASLVGLAFTPDVFACGVDVNGIANLETFLKSKDVKNDDYKIWYKWQTYVGDPENPEDLETLKAKSPFFHVDKINKPLLIVQGAKDKRVPRSEADAMVKALKSNNKEVKYILFPKESHYILWWSNRFRMINNIENFFGEHLGGRRILTDSI
ncbi:MAG: S9 family peptidase [Proteobacteria bacterium]|nr:S9 family peptidase [Pseudomonadota bacterium]